MKVEEQQVPGNSKALDTVKWLVVLALIIGGVVANSHYAGQYVVLRTLAFVVMLALSAGLAFTTTAGRAFWGMLQESRVELRKIVWPNWEETWRTSAMVMVMVVAASILLWLLDMGFGAAISALIG